MGLMINDVDLKTTYKFVTTDVNGRGAPPVERSTLEDLSFDGAIELGTKLAKRDISITVTSMALRRPTQGRIRTT